MRALVLLVLLAATPAHGRTFVEASVGADVKVTVKRINNGAWSGTIYFQTFDENGRLLSEDQVDAQALVSSGDRALVVDVLNRVWAGLYDHLAIPTPTPTPAP